MSVSGLTRPQRHIARELAVQAAFLSLHHAPAVHYSQGPSRFDGIKCKLIAAKGQFPTELDCSASVTWWLAQGLLFRFGLPDTVNGDHWLGGYTGTLASHGLEVHRPGLLRADVVLYGSGPPFEHTAMIVGWRDGTPLVISHGSEAGPFLLPFDYRPPTMIRRYI
jgi:hypothetical protein